MQKITLVFLLFTAISIANCKNIKYSETKIITGAERIETYLPGLRNKRVGLVVNQSSIVGKTHLLDTLLSLKINVKIIFSPEHGYGGVGDPGESIQNKMEEKSGIPIISLYGKKRKPSPEDLDGLDIVVFDIQDVGVRFYTYISTLHYVMEACAESSVPLLLLDRPNPNGFYIDGPVMEEKYRSFLGLEPIPIVYGLTIGELANMINNEGWLNDHIKCAIEVVKCENYTHNSVYNLPVNPSPNLRNMKAVYLYPTIGLFVGTEMSLGHGTDFPYLVIGHPDFPEKSFHFVPHPNLGSKNPELNGIECYGVDLNKLTVDSARNLKKIDIRLIQIVYHKMNESSSFFNTSFNYHAGNSELQSQIIHGVSAEAIRASWADGISEYKKIREKYLLYPDF